MGHFLKPLRAQVSLGPPPEPDTLSLCQSVTSHKQTRPAASINFPKNKLQTKCIALGDPVHANTGRNTCIWGLASLADTLANSQLS